MDKNRLLKVIGEIISDRYECQVTIKEIKGDDRGELHSDRQLRREM